MKKLSVVWIAAFLAACGDDGDGGSTGSVQAFVVAEETIPDGLTPGDGEENIQDGWAVSYDKFLAVVGNFRATRQGSAEQRASRDVFIVDMKSLPTSGFTIAQFDDLAATRWDRVGYDMPRAASDTPCAPSVSAEDCDFMRQHRFSVYFEATMTNPEGVSCRRAAGGGSSDCVSRTEVSFVFGLSSGTSFDDCSDEDDVPGFAVPSGGTVQVKPTIHGDHWFFDNITQGAEITARQAQWIADADRSNAGNLSDGVVTTAELQASTAGAFFPASLGYNLSGTLVPVTNGFTFLEAQVHTLGDYQGEGECPTREVLE
jgi:hypothetical protein